MKSLGLYFISFFVALFGINNQTDELIFFEQDQLKSIKLASQTISHLGNGSWPADENALKTDRIVYSKPELGVNLRTEVHFLQGVQSPHVADDLYYSDIPGVHVAAKLYRFNKTTQATQVIFIENQVPNPGHSFLPIGFGTDPDILFLQEMDILTNEEYLGVWEYRLSTNNFQKLDLTDNYMCTPILSSDRTKLYYTAASDPNRNVIHGVADLLMEFDIKTGTEKTLHQSSGAQIILLGVNSTKQQIKTTTLDKIYTQQTKIANDWKLPFTLDEDWCVTRDGSPRPPNPQTGQSSSSCGYSFNHHGYRATDWSNLNFPGSNNGQGPIVAARQGVVVSNYDLSPGSCGYGNLVRVSHDMGGGVTWYSYYAHLASVSVSINQCVGQGEGVGVEGGTGGTCSYGVHLHFEVRQSLSGSGQQQWVAFTDMNSGYPRQRDHGTSANAPTSCCALNVTTSTGNVTSDVTAGNSITSAGTVPNGSNVEFSAGAFVDLIPGFEAQNGSILDAYIGGCGVTPPQKTSVIQSEQPPK